MSDPIARPGDDDPGIEHAAGEVVDAWQGNEGKDPAATEDDFARMREGFGEVAAGGGDAGDGRAGGGDAGDAGAARGGDAGSTTGGDAGSEGGGDFATTSTREAQLRHAEEADEESTAANRASTGAGPDG
jgi:hypothetical protein